ncbi:MAG: C39 family peptidase [Armatimonadetes bacterium]|nr:C39 family peptidase [Armatimonadota bacterium]
MKTLELCKLVFLCTLALLSSAGWTMNVPMFGQGDQPWRNDPYGYPPSGATIYSAGCAMTSCAMVLRYYGVLKGPSGEDVNPRALNNWLKANGGYSNRTWVVWAKVAQFSSKAANKNGGKTIKFAGPKGHDTQTLDDDLREQRPVILQVPSPSGGPHFVVVTAPKNYVGYPINDPMRRCNNLSVCYSGWSSMRRFKPSGAGTSTTSDPSALSVYAYPTSVKILLVDSQGRRTGIDPNTWQELNEIPDSYYTVEQAIEDDETGEWDPNDATNVVEALTPAEGNYTLKVFSATGGDFTVEISDIDSVGESYDQTITGTLNPGQVLEYPITHATATPITAIGDAKVRGSGIYLTLADKIVSAGSDSASGMYVQEADRSAGIRVLPDPYDPNLPYAPGDVVTLSGYTYLVDDELILDAPVITRSSTGSRPKTVGMPNRDIGGPALGDQPGVISPYGLNNIGLLVETWGAVTYVGTDDFYIDDGSNLQDGSGNRGARIAATGLSKPSANDYVTVVGNSSVSIVNEQVVRTVRPRVQADISVIGSAGGGMGPMSAPERTSSLSSSVRKLPSMPAEGSIDYALEQPDGAQVCLKGVETIAGDGGIIGVKETVEPTPGCPRLFVQSSARLESLWWIDVEGAITTLDSGRRAVIADSILLYTDSKGRPAPPLPPMWYLYAPDWQWKTRIQ